MNLLKPGIISACIIAASIGYFSCNKQNQQAGKATSHAIISLRLDSGQVGAASITAGDTGKISLYVQNGIDLTSIVPRITISNDAIISPAPGEKEDFSTGAKIYTVTSQSGIVQKWAVKIQIYPAPDLSKYQPDVQGDSTFDKYFTRYSGWNSGDGAQSIPLPDGRVVWLFGDSFIGNVNPNRSLVPGQYTVVHNAMMVQTGASFVTYCGGTATNATALFTPANPNNFYWTMHGVCDNGKLYVFLMELGTDAQGNLVHEDNKMVVMDTSTFKTEKVINIPYYNQVSWGQRWYTNADGYNYGFGVATVGWNTVIYISRASTGHMEDMWEFYAGNNTWVRDITKAVPISVPPYITTPSIFNRNGRYYMVTQRNFGSQDILMYQADKPAGPYTNEITLYTTHEVSSTYLALPHPEFIENNRLLIGYSLSGNIFAMANNIDIGRPMFIRVNLPE
jgi:hypothetical protein